MYKQSTTFRLFLLFISHFIGARGNKKKTNDNRLRYHASIYTNNATTTRQRKTFFILQAFGTGSTLHEPAGYRRKCNFLLYAFIMYKTPSNGGEQHTERNVSTPWGGDSGRVTSKVATDRMFRIRETVLFHPAVGSVSILQRTKQNWKPLISFGNMTN